MYKYILWDHDGVLVDTEKYYFEATRLIFQDHGVELTQAIYLDYMARGETTWNFVRETGVSDEGIRAEKDRRNEIYREFIRTGEIEVEGVLETLEVLSRTYRMAIVTTSRRRDFQLIHEKRKIISYIEFVLDREDYEMAKPHPEPYLTALERFGAEPSEAVVVEDTSRGMASAIAAGIDCIVINHPFTVTQDFTGAKGSIDAITDLPGYLGVG